MTDLTTVERIKSELRGATTETKVEEICAKYRAEVRAMHDDPDLKIHALHLANLKEYLLRRIEGREEA